MQGIPSPARKELRRSGWQAAACPFLCQGGKCRAALGKPLQCCSPRISVQCVAPAGLAASLQTACRFHWNPHAVPPDPPWPLWSLQGGKWELSPPISLYVSGHCKFCHYRGRLLTYDLSKAENTETNALENKQLAKRYVLYQVLRNK